MTVIDAYEIQDGELKSRVEITENEDFVKRYNLSALRIDIGTRALLDEIKGELISTVTLQSVEIIDPNKLQEIKNKFYDQIVAMLQRKVPGLPEKETSLLVRFLLNEMLGLGELELLLKDDYLEDIAINTSTEPVWAYHRKHGWLKTNIVVPTEEDIKNYAGIIARRVGRQITNLNPLLDAHLVTQERANAVLNPISSKGNLITIRKFAKEPWTITDFINNRTLNSEVAALLWQAIQYELNILVSGGTGSGKTSMLSVLLPFIQPNQRIVSIEDTREIQLPKFLFWSPLTTRPPNIDKRGEITMLDLMINSLRMRPDRIVVGEIRREREAETLFEAMHTGHAVYATLHADTIDQTINRLKNPPINIHPSLLGAIDLNLVMFRDRRSGIRRLLQLGTYNVSERTDVSQVRANVLYKWNPTDDALEPTIKAKSTAIQNKIRTYTSLTEQELNDDLAQKQAILNWLVKNNTRKVDDIGRLIAEYYLDPSVIETAANKNKPPEELLTQTGRVETGEKPMGAKKK
ncbi:MAG: CpaF family protein [DPANN group archaeon]|nr:CpaF family protein [DPANN group archaeon]